MRQILCYFYFIKSIFKHKEVIYLSKVMRLLSDEADSN